MPNAPAKRAAILMISIGVLLLAGTFVSTMFSLLRPEWIDAQLKPYHEALGDNPLLRRPALTWMIAISGGLGLIESGLSITLGLYILRGKHWAILTSLVLTILRLVIVALLAVLAVAATLLEKAMRLEGDVHFHDTTVGVGPQVSPVWSLATGVGSTVVLLLLAMWLVQAMRIERTNVMKQQPMPSS